ncbi:hypothetical protein EHT25_26900 [Larkinella rosea]|uniref:Uncharacterized protein n=2 Tax=Larkinella rosea TaxID=2025312 RepID=A0A3P1BE55_9BACT|nr:hypothetical protein EHT25_26900 [Larkinella rosea]
MAVLDDDSVLVSEFARGVIRDVTKGGDYSDTNKDVFVSGMKHPGGITQLKNKRIIAADSGTGKVYDISAGGNAGDYTKIFEGISHPYGVIEFRNKLYTSFSNNEMSGIAQIEEGQIFDFKTHAYVFGFPVVLTLEPYRSLAGCGGSWSTAVLDDKLMFSHAALGAIYDVSEGGSYDQYRNSLYAWGLNLPLGMTIDPINRQLFVCERGNGDIKIINIHGGYSRFAQPLVTGFKDCSCIRFIKDGSIAYVCDRAVGTVYKLTFDLHKIS